MVNFSTQTRELSRRVTRWALVVALAFTVVYVAAAIVFSSVASAPLADAIAEVTAPWQYVAAEDVDDATHAEYAETVERVKVDVMRGYMEYAARLSLVYAGESFNDQHLMGSLYINQTEALAAGGSAADRVVLMTAEEIYSLAESAPDVLEAVSPHVQAAVRSADDVEIDASVFSAAAVALARSEGFAQACEKEMVLSSDLAFDSDQSATDWMQDVIRIALDLRNAGVAGSLDDGIYRVTYGWYDDTALVDAHYDEMLALGVYEGMGGYLIEGKTDSHGIAYENYYGDGHEEVRDLTWYTYLRGLREPLFVIGWLVGLLVIARLATRKSWGYFDKLSSALADVASGESSAAEKLPDELEAARRTMQDIARREDVVRREAQLTECGKNELVAYLAHDTKTPLTSVIGYLSILSEEPDLPQNQRQRYLNAALEKSYRLDSMIDEFFEIARFNITTLSIERAWCDPAVMCYQVAGELLPAAEARDITIDVQAKEGQRVFVDAPQLSRALSNVLKNAVSYADEGSTVMVKLDMEEKEANKPLGAAASEDADVAALAGRAKGTEAVVSDAGATTAHAATEVMRITVANQGSEISADHLERIFEKFYREDAARATERGGAGLGLAIAREIVQAHGGTIAATSHAGETIFAIEVPMGV